jgi:16S rRNA processing protein RimM
LSVRPAGRVGRAHGLDGSFYVEAPAHELTEGTAVELGGRDATIVRRAGTDARPIVRLDWVDDRDGAEAVRGETLLVADDAAAADSGKGEWYVAELVGCSVPGLGTVRRVVAAPSCDVLEVGDDAVLVPLVSDAIRRIDIPARTIEVNRRFLGLESPPADPRG